MSWVGGGFDSPTGEFTACTPNDTTEFNATRAVWVGTAGDITVDGAFGGTNITFTGVIGLLPFRVTRVYSTGTTASGIVLLR